MAAKLAEAVAGSVLIALMINDVFQTVIVPRAVSRRWRPSAYLTRILWFGAQQIALRISAPDRRDEYLGKFAPFALVAIMVLWLCGLIFGYGTLFYGLRDQLRPFPDFWTAVYFAGASLLTIGYGDVVPAGGWARLFAIFAGATGFAVVAVVTSFLFAIFGSFQQREVFVVTLGTRSGAPLSGVEFLARHARLGVMSALPATFRSGQLWIAQVMESHLAYPTLAYFRSSHDHESWIAALGTLLDAATLLITTVQNDASGEAHILHEIGTHAVHDLSGYFRVDASDDVGVERAEFETARTQLVEAGLPCRESDEAWPRFVTLRARYAGRLNALARFFDIPPAQWIGDRSLLSSPHGAFVLE